MHRVPVKVLLHRIERQVARIDTLRLVWVVPVQLQAIHVYVEELFVGRYARGGLHHPGPGSTLQFTGRQINCSASAELAPDIFAMDGRLDELERTLEENVLWVVFVGHVDGRKMNFQLATGGCVDDRHRNRITALIINIISNVIIIIAGSRGGVAFSILRL